MTRVRDVRHRLRILGFALVPLGVVATAGGVVGTAWAAYSSQVSNASSFAAGTVVLTNDSNGTSQATTGGALFGSANASGLNPQSTAIVKCVTVRSTGSLASGVRLYATNVTQTNSLLTYMKITIETGTATSTSGGACTGWSLASTPYAAGTIESFRTTYTSYGSGLSTGWSPSGGTSTLVFRITVQPANTLGTAQQSSSAQFDLAWEAQNT